MGATQTDSASQAILDMTIALALEADDDDRARERWAWVFDTVDDLLGRERMRLEDAALSLSIALPLTRGELIEDLRARQRARYA